MKNEKNVKDTTAKATAKKTVTVPKATKASVSQMLKDMLPQIVKLGGNDLAKKVDNALNNKKSTLESLQKLLSEVVEFGNTVTQPVQKVAVENSVKPKASVKKPTEKKAEPKKSAEKKEDLVPTVPQLAGAVPVAKAFPVELEVKDLGKLVIANSKYKTMEDVAKAMNPEDGSEPVQFYFATYWTARHIKEFNYSAVNAVKPVKSFPNNLDLLEPIYYCENNNRIWTASLYTEALFRFDGDDLSYIEDTDPYSGDKFSVRVSGGMEFEIYELAEQAK